MFRCDGLTFKNSESCKIFAAFYVFEKCFNQTAQTLKQKIHARLVNDNNFSYLLGLIP